MIGLPIKYENADGEEKTETFWFHLSKPELMRLQTSIPGGFGKLLQDLLDAEDMHELFKHFESIIFMAYGVREADGKGFEKSDELTKKFRQSFAYEALFDQMMADENAFANFVKEMLPKNFEREMALVENNQEGPKPPTS
jgi:hypothetical protein